MSSDDAHRHVRLTRLDTGVYRATNARGTSLDFGSRMEDGFSPVELLLAALGGCSAVDVDVVTSRHAEPERFDVDVDATYLKDDDGNRLTDVAVTFRLAFPDGEAGDRARARTPAAMRTSHDRSCTVSRTLEAATPVAMALDEDADAPTV